MCAPAIALLIARVMTEIGESPHNPQSRHINLHLAQEARMAAQIRYTMIPGNLAMCACFGMAAKYEQRLVKPQENVGTSIITAFRDLMKQFIAEWNGKFYNPWWSLNPLTKLRV